jgi:2-polyprenyl-3-methyl-5-hydroxy-6-metoxy-1,4-benzoquinol methylase
MNDLKSFRDFVYGNYHDTHGVYSADTIGGGRRAQLRAFLAGHLPADRTAAILDFGCGDGALLSIAEELGYTNLSGVDLAAGLLERAATRTRATLHRADGLDFLRSNAATYSAIVAFDVLEHLTRPELLDALRQFHESLSPGGVLLLHLPNGASPHHGRIRWGDMTHELAFTAHALGQLLVPLGFTVPRAYEDRPVAHGLKSAVRAALWQIVRLPAVVSLIAETGVVRGHVLTMNMFVVCSRT